MIDLSPEHRAIVEAIVARRLPGRRVLVFGSRASGRARRHSDLDLAIAGPVPDALTLAELRLDFEESDLPFKVDVLALEEAPARLRREIERCSEPIAGT